MTTASKYSVTSLLGLLFSAAGLVVVVLIYFSLQSGPNSEAASRAKRLAGELADNNLPEAAIEQYQQLLSSSSITNSERGAINYLIAKLYFEKMGNYQEAAAYYIKARYLDSDASYSVEAGRNLIASMEKMGRRLDARRELARQVSSDGSLSSDSSSGSEKLIARVGDYKITLSDFNRAVESLPFERRESLTTPEAKTEFARQMVGKELLYRAAVREGFDRDPDMLKDIMLLEKEFISQYFIRQKIVPSVQPDTAGMNLFYRANLEKYGGRAIGEVNTVLRQDYIDYLAQNAINEYINQLIVAEPVKIYKENLR